MFKNVNKLILMLFLLLIIVPITFASDVIDNNQSSADNSIINDSLVSTDDTGDNIYFNASVSSDGNGTKENPYKNLDFSKLKANSTAYIAEGTYNLNYQYLSYSVTLIGQNPENTILNYTWGGTGIDVSVDSNLTLKDLTINHLSIRNYGTVNATNVIFKNGIASDYSYYGNTYGGAIYNYYTLNSGSIAATPVTRLFNCTFIGNSAMYGGAIYVYCGELFSYNSRFINNTAQGFGGSIVAEGDSRIYITNTTFENSKSEDDAGGAIYSLYSDLRIKNSTFINCSANFGGAICSLNSDMIISYSNFTNNSAGYEGGAIYKMYGYVKLTSSNFTSNSALNGGAFFVDNCTTLDIKDSNFILNEASGIGGAIFSNANPTLTLNGVNFEDNKASSNPDILNQENFTPIVSSNDNYSLFVYNSLFNGTLPARYSLVDEGYVTDVKNQESTGNCWAFASLASLESCILKASNKTFNFSVENMKNLIEMYSAYGWTRETNYGGYMEMSMGYLASWLGPVNATLDSFDDLSTLSPILDSEIHIQNMYVLPARNNYTDNNAIKEAILKYGAIYASYYHDNSYYNYIYNSYYCPSVLGGNHAITIVGWDDNFSKNNFRQKPEGDGAFIVKNSWGSTWGDKGYFYISYYDKNLFAVGDYDAAFTFILNDTVRYTKNYQYDVAGRTNYIITYNNAVWYQNSFNATGDELIAAISTYFNTTADYEISVYVNDILKLTQNGKHEGSGYYTIPLNEYVSVMAGDTFKIVIKLSNPQNGYSLVPVSVNNYITRFYSSPGISYFSYDGKNWIDLYSYQTTNPMGACLKAFTIADKQESLITLNVSDSKVQELNEIIATVMDVDGNLIDMGEVIFNIDGNEYRSDVAGGIAKVNITFNKSGEYVISAIYQENALYFKSSTQKTINVTKWDVELAISVEDIIYGENPVVLISSNVYGEIVLRINNKNYTVNIANNNTEFTVQDILNAGEYLVNVSYGGSDKYNSVINQTNFAVNKKDITMDVAIDTDFRDIILNVNLSEKLNGFLTVSLNNVSYTLSYVNGSCIYRFKDLSYGDYVVNVTFARNNYNTVSVLRNVELKTLLDTTITLNNPTFKVQESGEIVATVKDVNGNLVNIGEVVFTVNGEKYNSSVVNGVAKVNVSFDKAGDYLISANYQNNTLYKESGIQKTVNVTKWDVKLAISVEDIIYGENPVANISFDIIDKVVLTVNKKNYIVYNSSKFVIPDILDADEYLVNVSYAGSDKYNSAANFTSFKVVKKNITMDVTIDIDFRDIILNVNLSDKINGSLTVLLNNRYYTLSYVNGSLNYTFKDLTYGDYVVNVTFTDDNYNTASVLRNVELKTLLDTTITLNNPMPKVQELTEIIATVNDVNGNLVNTGEVIFTIGGKEYSINVVGGVAKVNVSFDKAGDYLVLADYQNNTLYKESSTQKTVNVTKYDVNLAIGVEDIVYGENIIANISFNGVNITDNVTLRINNKEYPIEVINGIAIFTVSDMLNASEYIANVSYAGNDKYNPVNSQVTFVVNKKNITMDVAIDTDFRDITVNVNLSDKINGSLTVLLNNTPYTLDYINGSLNYTFKDLTYGDYVVNVTFADDNYNTVSVLRNVELKTLLNTIITLNNPMPKVQELTEIIATVNDVNGNLVNTGEVIFTVNGEKYNSSVVDGVAKVNVSFDKASDYLISANYQNNTLYKESSTQKTVNVTKWDVKLAISVGDIIYGENPVANISFDIIDKVVLTVNKNNYTVYNNSKFVIPDILDAGEYLVNVSYSGSDKYNLASNFTSFKVAKKNITMDVAIETDLRDITVNVNLSEKLNGSLTVLLNNMPYTLNYINGSLNYTFKDLTYGDYVVNVTFTNDNYNTVSVLRNVELKTLLDTIIILNNPMPKVRELTEIIATVKDVNGNLVNTGEVIFSIGGKKYNRSVVDGVAKVNVSFDKAGDYLVLADYQTSDLYNKSSTQKTVNVNKYDVNLAISVEDIVYGENPTVLFSFDIVDKVVLTVNKKNYTVYNSSKFIIPDILDAGEYIANVSYTGSDKYNSVINQTIFTINKKNITMDVAIDTDFRDITLKVNLSDKINGSLTVLLNNTPYSLNYINGSLNYTFKDLTYGDYVVNVTFTNDNYNTVSVLRNVELKTLLDTTITLNNPMPKVRELTEIIATVKDVNGNLVNTGKVIFTVNGEKYNSSVVDGVAKVNVSFDKAKTYVIIANYQNNTIYKESSTQKTVNVTNWDVKLAISVGDIVYGVHPIANISFNGVNITDNVVLTVNKKNYTVNVVNGIAIFTVPDMLNAGEYIANVSYTGSDKYNPANSQVTFKVNKKEITMDVAINKYYRDLSVNVNLSEKINGSLTVLLNNTHYTLNYINGTLTHTFKNINYGNYTVKVVFTKDNYETVDVSENIEITVIKTVLEASDVVMYYKNGTRFVVSLKDIYNNPLANMDVSISINGREYIRQTDEKGIASMALNLDSKTYNVVTKFNGTSKYAGDSINNTVSILPSIVSKNIVKYYKNDTQFYATLFDFNGNPLAKKEVRFNINGVFYTRQTDSNGIAKLSINLRPGLYTITTFNQVTGEQIGNSVEVLSKIVENHDLVKYYKNASKFSVKILDNYGNPIVKTTVTFNINGVFYYRQTDVNGIASLSINLRPGKYVITTIYDQYEVGNTVDILPTVQSSDLEMNYQDGSKFRVKIVDGRGNPLINQNVTFNVNGVFYNKITDNDGIASLTINLMRGEYIITSLYEGFETGNTIKIN